MQLYEFNGQMYPAEVYRKLKAKAEEVELTRKEIMGQLREKGIKFKATAKTEELQLLINQ